MADIQFKLIPDSTWNLITYPSSTDEGKTAGIAIYPEFVVWKPTQNATKAVQFVDAYGNVFSSADYNITIFQQMSFDYYGIRKSQGLNVDDYVVYSSRDINGALGEQIGFTEVSNGICKSTDPSKNPFRMPTDEQLGKVDGLTKGIFPYTGIVPADTRELTTSFWDFVGDCEYDDRVLEGEIRDMNRYIPDTEDDIWKLPPLFEPIGQASKSIGFEDTFRVTILGIEPKK